ncbi:MAG: nitronate monooxygenase [Clostridia bacterium]|nr:nitronate monooxygenase [Clostridia bacterium]
MSKISIGKKIFDSRFFVASSDLISTAEEAEKVIQIGGDNIGSIIWKSTTLEARKGYDAPRICDFYDGFLVASGLKNTGIDETIKEIRKFKAKYPNQSVIISIASVNFINSIDEFKKMAIKLKDEQIDGIELNLSCPHQVEKEKFKTQVLAQDENLVGIIVAEVKNIFQATNKIVIVKLTGWNADISKVSKVAEVCGADAITVSNIFPGMGYYTGLKEYNNSFEYKVGDPLVGNFKGGYTGILMLPATILLVNTVKNAVNIPIIATGGCMSQPDAMIQTFMAGASVVASATFFYNKNCCECRDFSKDLIEMRDVLKEFEKNKIIKFN